MTQRQKPELLNPTWHQLLAYSPFRYGVVLKVTPPVLEVTTPV